MMHTLEGTVKVDYDDSLESHTVPEVLSWLSVPLPRLIS